MTLVKEAGSRADEARRNIANVVQGYSEAVRLLFVALATQGHILLEGVPGVGKTTLAKAFASTAGLEFRRVQMTPDLMPADITGHTYYDQKKGTFEIRRGPAFTNILLADEINRAPPRTQSSLLEVMEERTVTIDGQTLPVPDPFIVVATKNPIDIEGVYPLPEAELDRFMIFIDMRYPALEIEKAMLMTKLAARRVVPPTPELVTSLRAAHAVTTAHPDIVDYIVRITRATREEPDVELGAGPRGSEHLLAAARAAAVLEGRDYVVPDDVKGLAVPVLAHRLILAADAEVRDLSTADVVQRVLERVEPPVGAGRHA